MPVSRKGQQLRCALQMQVELANHDPAMKEGIGQRLAD